MKGKPRKGVALVVEIGPERHSNRMPGREEFAPVKGKSTERDVKRVQREDDKNDRALAKRNKVRFKG